MNGSRFVVLSLVVVVILAAAPPAIAAHADEAIVLPGASSAEGIAKGTGSTFYAGDLLRGDIFRGDVRRGTAELFIDAPDGRMAAGMAVDVRHRLLFVAGVSTGGAYVYDTRTGATVASYQFTDRPSLINDVAISKDGAWFTDSVNAVLYHVPIGRRGTLGAFRTLTPHRTRGRHDRRSQQQRHPGHAQRQGADRRAQRPGRAEPRRPVHRRELRDRGPEPAGRRRSAACGTPPLVRGAELPQPDRRNPAQSRLPGRRRAASDHQRAVPGPGDGRALRPPPGRRERQIRHRVPAHRRPVRGGRRTPVMNLSYASSQSAHRRPVLAPPRQPRRLAKLSGRAVQRLPTP